MADEPAAAEGAAHGAEGEVHAGTEAHGGSHGTDVFPPFDSSTFPSQLFWLAITFVALYYLMAKVALPRIAGILENRRDRIASDLDQAERLKTQSDEAIQAYETALGEARTNAAAIADKARDEAREEAEGRRTALEADLAAKLTDAEARIAEIKATALREVGTIATDAAETIVGTLTDIDATTSEVELAVSNIMNEEQNRAG